MTRNQAGLESEERFIQLFSEAFGAEKAAFLCTQYRFEDIYRNSRQVDFLLQHDARRVAIEIVEEPASGVRLQNTLADRLLRANSMTHLGWEVYRWPARQMEMHPQDVKEELRLFLGAHPCFQEIADFLPPQRSRALDGSGLELWEHQKQALAELAEMRRNRETIALLCQATGTGKTVTAVKDAMLCGGRVLFLAHTRELVEQAVETFRRLWKEVRTGKFADGVRDTDTHVVCGSIQSVSQNLECFSRTAFSYLIVDEAHHATAESYQKVLAYFRPSFTLGLTATPDRADDRSILEVFRNTACHLDIRSAVEMGELVPIRCIRVHTNIDLSDVRYNSIQYNLHDLETRLYVPERNRLIVDTWERFCPGRRTVVFCVSVRHAEQIAALFRARGIAAAAVSGGMRRDERQRFQEEFRSGKVPVLCACDLLNEGWDCPEVEVLFMARPTMSRVLYTQQLGRGMRKAPGKEFLTVFDFVDNAGRFNCPYSIHRLFHLRDYWPGQYVAAPAALREKEAALYRRGQKPAAVLDWPIDASDYELVELFNWQEEAQDMISQMEFVRRVNVQEETINRYVKTGKLKADLEVPLSGGRTFRYFRLETLQSSAEQFGWTLIVDGNRKEIFLQMVRQMTMSYSYKPVLLKAIFEHADGSGRVPLAEVVQYFREFYEDRRRRGLVVEKPDSLYARGSCTDREIERNILSFPFRRFESMGLLRHTKTLGILQVEETVWNFLTEAEKAEVVRICDVKLEEYYRRNLGT